MGAYQALDLTIGEALHQRSPDFPGVVICTASDSLGTLMQLIKKRRVHRLVVVEGDVSAILFPISEILGPNCYEHPTPNRRKRRKVARKVDSWVSSL